MDPFYYLNQIYQYFVPEIRLNKVHNDTYTPIESTTESHYQTYYDKNELYKTYYESD